MARRRRTFRRRDPVPQVGDLGLQRFLEGVHARLKQGAAEYGNESFERNRQATITEVLTEQLDTAGWLFVLWVQVRTHAKRIELKKDVLARFQLQFLTAISTWIELGIKLDDEGDQLTTTGAICDEITKLAASAFYVWQALQQRLDHALNKLFMLVTEGDPRPIEHIGKRGGLTE